MRYFTSVSSRRLHYSTTFSPVCQHLFHKFFGFGDLSKKHNCRVCFCADCTYIPAFAYIPHPARILVLKDLYIKRMKMRRIFLLCTVAIACILIVGASALALFYNSVGRLCPHASFETTVTPPTCESGGSTLYCCSLCGYSYVSDHTPPRDHKMLQIEVEATCGAAGYVIHYCECGYSYRSSHTPPLEHSLYSVEHSASCTEQGYVSYNCENCDYAFRSNFCEPLGHKFSTSSARPTATRAGYTD